jgi:hypothetical protein
MYEHHLSICSIVPHNGSPQTLYVAFTNVKDSSEPTHVPVNSAQIQQEAM